MSLTDTTVMIVSAKGKVEGHFFGKKGIFFERPFFTGRRDAEI